MQPYLGGCAERLERRVKADPDFAYLAGDIDRLAKNLASKSVSLNEADRRQELAQEKAREGRSTKRSSARAGRQGPSRTPSRSTNVDAPGLPLPSTSRRPAPPRAG